MKANKSLAKDFFKKEVEDYKKEFYESGYRTFMSIRLERFLEEIEDMGLSTEIECLDAGCGPGYLTYALAKKSYNVTALDSSPEMLRLTKALLDSEAGDVINSVKLTDGDIENLIFGNSSFDLVASAGVLEYLPTDHRILSEFYRVLRPGGYMILSSTNKISPAGYLDPIVEIIKRNKFSRYICNWFLSILGGTPVRARNFSVRKHTKGQLVNNVNLTGFKVIKVGYFYALPFPHPFDRIFPATSNKLGVKLEKLKETVFASLFEGIYVVAIKN